jgi:hypothetical protein
MVSRPIRTCQQSPSHKNFSSASLSYALTDPEDKSITVRPALTLQRNVGNDLLSGNGNVNKTVFGLTLQIN